MKATFTKQQLSDWQEYEYVRQSGAFNMFDARARRATGLGRDEYLFVMKNYGALKAAVEAEIAAGQRGPDGDNLTIA